MISKKDMAITLEGKRLVNDYRENKQPGGTNADLLIDTACLIFVIRQP